MLLDASTATDSTEISLPPGVWGSMVLTVGAAPEAALATDGQQSRTP